MTRQTLDRLLHSLLLVRLGQELGTDSQAARAVAAAVDFLIQAAAIFSP